VVARTQRLQDACGTIRHRHQYNVVGFILLFAVYRQDVLAVPRPCPGAEILQFHRTATENAWLRPVDTDDAKTYLSGSSCWPPEPDICDLFAVGRPDGEVGELAVLIPVSFVGDIPVLPGLEVVYGQIAFIPVDMGEIPSVGRNSSIQIPRVITYLVVYDMDSHFKGGVEDL
jgi:hypothetical protein